MKPNHIAIICDGNRRWATSHGFQAMVGHKTAAFNTFEPLVKKAAELGISYLTFWVFSTENWKRSPAEVQALLDIFRTQFEAILPLCHEHHIRIKTIGDLVAFPEDIRQMAQRAVNETAQYDRITVVFGMNYGGRDELTRAINTLLQAKKGDTAVTQEDVANALDTAGMPDPDMVIRTSGEQRLSGFLPWQTTYSELFFIPEYFPELKPEKLVELVQEFEQRQRRFGG